MTSLRLFAILSVIVVASPSLADTTYSWEEGSGSLAFSDDMGNVPDAYKNSVTLAPTGKLLDYEFLTVEISNDDVRRERLETLRMDREATWNSQSR